MVNNILLRIASLNNQKTLAFMVIASALFYFMMFDDGSSLDVQIDQVNQMLQQEKVTAVESEKALNEVEKIRSQVGALSEQFRLAAQQLPSELQMAEILRSIDIIARTAGVAIKSKEPMAPKAVDILEVTPLRISAVGSYSEIAMFLYFISSMERITRVDTVKITMAPRDNTSRNSKTSNLSNALLLEGEIANYRYTGDKKK